jgi:RES domain-containing protein
MLVYRIAKMKERALDLSGKGAFLYGGRWNSEGVFMLYTSTHASLAMLEVLVHADESEIPPQLFISQIDISEKAPIYQFPDEELPENWREPDNLGLKKLGDQLMKERQYLGFQVSSAVLPSEFNILLNPLFPGYADLVKVSRIDPLKTDPRLMSSS